MINYKIEPCPSCHGENVKDMIWAYGENGNGLTVVRCSCSFQIQKLNASREEMIRLWNRLSKLESGIKE